ncbi:MAG: O-antigen ligase family protein [Aliidongia sp.]
MTDTAPRDGRPAAKAVSSADILPVLLAVFGPLVYVAPLGAVPGLLVLAVGAAFTAWRYGAMSWRGILRGFLVFAPLFVWMLLSSLWSLDARAGVSLALRLAGVFVAGTAVVYWLRTLPLDRLARCLPALALGFSAAAAIVLVDLRLLHGQIALHLHAPQGENYDVALFYGRGATIHAILMVPLLLGLWQAGARWLAILQFVLGLLAILVTSSLSAKMALGTAVLVGGAVFVLPALRYALLVLLAALVVALPLVLPYHPDPTTVCWLSDNKASALHRLYIWNFATERIAEHPLIGWGLDAARRIPGGDGRVLILRCDAVKYPGTHPRVDSTVMPLHPHNGILQVWLELGGIGALFGFGAVILILGRAFTAPEWRSRAAQAGFVGIFLGGLSVGLVSFGIWQEWFLAALFIAAAVAVLAARQGATDQPRR